MEVFFLLDSWMNRLVFPLSRPLLPFPKVIVNSCGILLLVLVWEVLKGLLNSRAAHCTKFTFSYNSIEILGLIHQRHNAEFCSPASHCMQISASDSREVAGPLGCG